MLFRLFCLISQILSAKATRTDVEADKYSRFRWPFHSWFWLFMKADTGWVFMNYLWVGTIQPSVGLWDLCGQWARTQSQQARVHRKHRHTGLLAWATFILYQAKKEITLKSSYFLFWGTKKAINIVEKRETDCGQRLNGSREGIVSLGCDLWFLRKDGWPRQKPLKEFL